MVRAGAAESGGEDAAGSFSSGWGWERTRRAPHRTMRDTESRETNTFRMIRRV
jgi:hypothetical protein